MSAHEQTNKVLADQVADLQKQLRDREMADVAAAAETLRKTQEAAAALQAAQAKAALDADVEKTRAGSWITYLLATARPDAPVNAAAMMASVPKFGWAPGDGPENYSFAGAPAAVVIEDVGSTFLGRMAAERGLKF